MTKKIIFKKIFLNPFNIKRKSGITKKIAKVTLEGDDSVTIEFYEEPNHGEIQAILQMLNQNRWEEIKE